MHTYSFLILSVLISPKSCFLYKNIYGCSIYESGFEHKKVHRGKKSVNVKTGNTIESRSLGI